MRPEDDLSNALEALRHRPVVAESREYALQWERSRARRDAVRRIALGPIGVSAGVCVVAWLIFGLLPKVSQPSLQTPQVSAKNLLETGVGETRTVALDDGSRLVLDTSSRLRVDFTASTRNIELLEGQAHFEVAKDPIWPFRVLTKSAEVVAVGTQFDVEALPTGTSVTLIEGRVNVRTLSGTPRTEALTPGEQLEITNDGQILLKRTVKLESVTAWQRGTIVLDDMPLAEALPAINRYSMTQIIIPNAQLQSRRVSGVFRIGDVETEALALQRYFDLTESSRSERAIVLERSAGATHGEPAR